MPKKWSLKDFFALLWKWLQYKWVVWMCVECKWHQLGLSRSATKMEKWPPYPGMVVTWVWWSPGYGGHLGMVVTWVWWSTGYGGHLGMVVTWVWWSPEYGGHLGMVVTWVWWSPGWSPHPDNHHTQITTTLRLGRLYWSFHSHLRWTSNLLPPALFSLLGF